MSFFLFVFVGALGFVVDSALLYMLKNDLGLYFSRAISFFCAVVTTWALNRIITFKNSKSGLPGWKEFLLYLKFMLIGGIVNYLTYAAALSFFLVLKQYPIVAVGLGSFSGLFVNYITSRYFLFSKN